MHLLNIYIAFILIMMNALVFSPLDSSPKGELRTIVQKEVKEEVIRLTSHLEKRLQESTDQLNTALTALETRLQPKK